MTLTDVAPTLPLLLCALLLASSVTALLRHRMDELRSGRLHDPQLIRRRRRRHPLCEFMPPRSAHTAPERAISLEARQHTAHSRRLRKRECAPLQPVQLTLISGERRSQPRPGTDRRRGPLQLVS